MRDQSAGFVRKTERAAGPGVDADAGQVGDPALAAGLDETRISLDDALHIHELLDLNGWPRRRKITLGQNPPLGQRRGHLPDSRFVAMRDVHARLARQSFSGDVIAKGLGRRLAQLDRLKQRAGSKFWVGLDKRHHGADFVGAQWRQSFEIRRRRWRSDARFLWSGCNWDVHESFLRAGAVASHSA